jgi:hypothetical protein
MHPNNHYMHDWHPKSMSQAPLPYDQISPFVGWLRHHRTVQLRPMLIREDDQGLWVKIEPAKRCRTGATIVQFGQTWRIKTE